MPSFIPRIKYPELVFGFVSPIGTDLSETLAAFRKFFKSQNYNVIDIKITDRFRLLNSFINPNTPLIEEPEYERYSSYIKLGNTIRRTSGDYSILSGLAIVRIIEERLSRKSADPNNNFQSNVFLVQQFKRKEEIELMRAVYGKLFFQVSVYSRKNTRAEYLFRNFASKPHDPNVSLRAKAYELIDTDENEAGDEAGQRVGEIFHDADLIVNIDVDKIVAAAQVDRFCELLFSSNSITPTKIEYGMFAAKSAALRSADLSRQVGAAIFSLEGDIISMGANDVPKGGGGLYWSDDEHDTRDYVLGYDSNEIRKTEISKQIIANLKDVDSEHRSDTEVAINNSPFRDVLEYTRVVHAEMAAITDAARRGLALKGNMLYCTTFPCHNCAKHIVASGLSEVVFLEPYPKSLTGRLHPDSVEIEQQDRGRFETYESTKFVHFYGVTPRRYRELFERGKRKKGGKFQYYIDDQKQPLPDIKSPFYSQLERVVLLEVLNAIGRNNFSNQAGT